MSKNLKYFFAALLLSLSAFWGLNIFQKNFNSYLTAQISKPLDDIPLLGIQEKQRPPLEIDAAGAISVEIAKNGQQKVLFSKNDRESLPIASLTKLMSAVFVAENPDIFDYSKTITISPAAARQRNTPNYGNLTAGEQYTLEKLMELMLIYSSNDAAYAIAEIPGVDNFVSDMNRKAAMLGMQYTYFVNPNGLDPIGAQPPNLIGMNHSTASDLAKLAAYILSHDPKILELTSQAENIPSIENGLANLELDPSFSFVGGKTGYTTGANGCILFVFRDTDGNTYVNVILGTDTEGKRISEMQKLIDWIEG